VSEVQRIRDENKWCSIGPHDPWCPRCKRERADLLAALEAAENVLGATFTGHVKASVRRYALRMVQGAIAAAKEGT
jgi:hypothetical protein